MEVNTENSFIQELPENDSPSIGDILESAVQCENLPNLFRSFNNEFLSSPTSNIVFSAVVYFLQNHKFESTMNIDLLVQKILTRKSTGLKCNEASQKLRNRGNDTFKNNGFLESRKYYQKSIAFAPEGSKELALAYGNSSAVNFALKRFKSCIIDCGKALKYGYPSNLQHKIYYRLSQSFYNLDSKIEAKRYLLSGVKCLEDSNVPVPKSFKDLELLLDSTILTPEYSFLGMDDLINLNGSSNHDNLQAMSELSFHENPNIANMSEALDIRENSEVGRHVVANRFIKKHEVLFLEEAFVHCLESNLLNICDFCLQNDLESIVPCKSCPKFVYCSEKCRDKSWDEYHHWECTLLSCYTESLGISHLALRMLFRGVKTKFYWLLQNTKAKFGQDKQVNAYSLITNEEKMDVDTIVMYGLMSKFLMQYLTKCTNITDELKHIKNLEADQIQMFILNEIFNNICRVQCNASVNIHKSYVMTGLYPSVSMMNHSCIPNTIEEYHGKYLIIRARNNITKNAEVFNCYGVNYENDIHERRQNLLNQYYFTCKCLMCENQTD